MSERSKESHSRCDVATREGSNPSLCIFYFLILKKNHIWWYDLWICLNIYHSIDSINSFVNSSSSVFTLIFNKQPILVSKARIKIIRTSCAPKNLPARLTVTMLAWEDSGLSIFLSPKCLNSSCSAAWVELYLSWYVLFSSYPLIFSHMLVNWAGSKSQGAMYEDNLISKFYKLNSSW